MVHGVGPDAEIVSNGNGYKTSATPYRVDLLGPHSVLHIAAISSEGAASHGDWNWLKGTVEEHLNKAMIHALAYLAGDDQDDHLGHAAWRMMAALEIQLRDREATEQGVYL